MQGVFHLNSHPPRTDPSHGRKTSSTWCASSGSSTVSIRIIWYFGWCQSPLHLLAGGWTHRGLKRTHAGSHNQAVSTASSISKSEKKENKTGGWAPAGGDFIHWCHVYAHKKLDYPTPPSTKASHVKATEHLWFQTKTFHLLSQLTFCILATLHNQTFQTKSNAASPSSICTLIQASHFHTFVSFWP